MTQTKLMRVFTLLLVAATLGACAADRSMKEFASVTAANVSVINSSLARYAEDGAELGRDRAQAMQDLSNALDRSERQFAEDYIVLDRMGESDVYDALKKVMRDSREIQLLPRDEVRTELLEEILATRAELTAPTNDLRSVTKTLGALGKEREAKDNIRFYANFAKQVFKDIEDAREQQERASSDARAATNSARNSAIELGTSERSR